MITQLFWPKEMHGLVKQYRAEGTLNEEAFQSLKMNTWFILFGVLFCVSLTFIPPSGDKVVIHEIWPISYMIFSIFFFICFSKAITHFLVRTRFFPYTIGDIVYAKVTDISIGRGSSFDKNHWRITYTAVASNEKSGLVTLYFTESLGQPFSKGDEILILVNPYNKKSTVPYIKEMERKCKLTTEPIKYDG